MHALITLPQISATNREKCTITLQGSSKQLALDTASVLQKATSKPLFDRNPLLTILLLT